MRRRGDDNGAFAFLNALTDNLADRFDEVCLALIELNEMGRAMMTAFWCGQRAVGEGIIKAHRSWDPGPRDGIRYINVLDGPQSPLFNDLAVAPWPRAAQLGPLALR